jgi:hypothetical protein
MKFGKGNSIGLSPTLKAGQESLNTKFGQTVRFIERPRILTDGVDYPITSFGKKGNCIEQCHILLDGVGYRTTKFDNKFAQLAGERMERAGRSVQTVLGKEEYGVIPSISLDRVIGS